MTVTVGLNTDDLREWALRDPTQQHYINRHNMMHTRVVSCGGPTCQPVPDALVTAAWEHGVAKSSRGESRVIGWCPFCCVEQEAKS